MNFAPIIGREFVVKLKTKKNGYTGIDYAGIYQFDHMDIPVDVRAALGLPPLAGAAPAANKPAAPATAGSTTTSPAAPGKTAAEAAAEVASGLFS